MQLDSDDDAQPYYKPPAPAPQETSNEPEQSLSPSVKSPAEEAAEAAAAAVAEEEARQHY